MSRSKLYATVIVLLSLKLFSCSGEKEISVFATTDLHGMLLPFDNTENRPSDHSLANLATLIDSVGNSNMVLLDNGDILQGDPLVYYYNFIDTSRVHIVADLLDYLGYDAETAGNHDIETGHKVYDRIVKLCRFPVLAANAVDVSTGEPYFRPYAIINKKGLKIIVFGMITPSVPDWLPESLYSGIRFEGMLTTARKWMPEMEKEKPDIIIGLFHSGMGDDESTDYDENNTLAVAKEVPGFDLILCGHDHNQAERTVINNNGDSVLVLDGGSRASVIMNADIRIKKERGEVSTMVSGRLISTNSIPASDSFIERYQGVMDTVKEYTSEVIGKFDGSATTRDAFFGPSAFVDLIHEFQLDQTGADISLTAPLSFDQRIDSGEICIRDMFKLYRYENFLYTLKMTGREIDSHLEHSSSIWFNTMTGSNSFLLDYRTGKDGKPLIQNGRYRLRYPSYNFDSAMGIDYVIDVRKPAGDRVTIMSLDDGRPFCEDSLYTVAVNSYRANGGGGHFAAAGITHEVLQQRLVSETDRDIRYYMTEWIRKRGEIKPEPLSHWSVIPGTWVSQARSREAGYLFGD